MYTGYTYKIRHFLFWTRRSFFLLLILGFIPPVLYEIGGLTWLAVPSTIISLVGTATAFLITFRSQSTYSRTMEAREIWGATMSAIRAWAMMCRDFFDDEPKTRELIYRQLAWLTALRYQLRAPRVWETVHKNYNKEYTRHYSIPEREMPLEQELSKYISQAEVTSISSAANKATQLMSHQSDTLKKLHVEGLIDEFRFLNMHEMLKEFAHHQGRSERIKNFPYPRQYVTINVIFVRLFCILLPFGLLEEFDKLNEKVTGFLHGNMVWLVAPFSALISWVFTSLEQVGESAENPFEGNPNDVPISQMSRAVEIDVRQMLKEVNLPPAVQPQNDIVL